MNKIQRQQGQSLVEFGLIIPIVILILLVILDLGRVIYYYSAIQNGAREGARYGIINPLDTSGVEARVRALTPGLDQSQLTVTRAVDGDYIHVTVGYSFRAVTPVIPTLFGMNQLNLETEAVMRIEQ